MDSVLQSSLISWCPALSIRAALYEFGLYDYTYKQLNDATCLLNIFIGIFLCSDHLCTVQEGCHLNSLVY